MGTSLRNFLNLVRSAKQSPSGKSLTLPLILFPVEDMSPPELLFFSFSCFSATEVGVGSCDEPMLPYWNEAEKLLGLGLLMLSAVPICSEFWYLATKHSYSNRSGLAFV